MPRAARAALYALVAAGVALRLWQYLANASLWIDEIALAQNVLFWPLAHLLGQPLALDQVAPPGFLAAVKGVTWVVGPSERALRFVPFAGGVAGLLIFPVLGAPVSAALGHGLCDGALRPRSDAHCARRRVQAVLDRLALRDLLALAAFGLDGAASRGRWIKRRSSASSARGSPRAPSSSSRDWGWRCSSSKFGGARHRQADRASRRVGSQCRLAALSGIHRVPPAMREYLDRFWNPFLPKATVLAFIAVAAVVLWRARSPRGAAPPRPRRRHARRRGRGVVSVCRSRGPVPRSGGSPGDR